MEKLKILIVANGVMTNILGALKVHYELKEEYEKQGHEVDILDYAVIYPKGRNAFTKIFGVLPTVKFWMHLKNIAYKYNVIDANVECIVYPKESFNFKGVLLARSHGMRPVYDLAENIKSFKKMLTDESVNIKFKTRLGNIYRSIQKELGLKEFYASIECADIVHCLNTEEYKYLLDYGVSKDKLVLIPNGLDDNIITAYNKESSNAKANSLSFVGSWTLRKGIKDFNDILSLVRNRVNIKEFYLLGGYTSEERVKKDFEVINHDVLKIVPKFEPEQLFSYLKTCKVGIFPSYVEGFGLAVVEQLACGIPVVAYKVPGPTDILKSLDETLLIEPGDKKAFAEKVIEILQLNDSDFANLSERCKQESKKYLLSDISRQFLDVYRTKLN